MTLALVDRIRTLPESIASQATRLVGRYWGETFPYYYVCEFPKSGGTWLSRMVAEYLRIPFPQNSVLPIGFSAVLQNHWAYHPGHRRVFYLWRDGRDVYTSLLFERIRIGSGVSSAAQRRAHRRNQKMMGKDYLTQDSRSLMPRFLQYELTHPGHGTHLRWHEHVAAWYRPEERPDIAYLSYEQLRDDCFGTMKEALEKITKREVDSWLLQTTIERCSFERMSNRKTGEEDRSQHIRKGVVGDWENHFTREAAEIFNDLAGNMLVTLGCEVSTDWINQCELE